MPPAFDERITQFCADIEDLVAAAEDNAVTHTARMQLTATTDALADGYKRGRAAADAKRQWRVCERHIADVRHWLRILEKSLPQLADTIAPLYDECDALAQQFKRASARI